MRTTACSRHPKINSPGQPLPKYCFSHATTGSPLPQFPSHHILTHYIAFKSGLLSTPIGTPMDAANRLK